MLKEKILRQQQRMRDFAASHFIINETKCKSCNNYVYLESVERHKRFVCKDDNYPIYPICSMCLYKLSNIIEDQKYHVIFMQNSYIIFHQPLAEEKYHIFKQPNSRFSYLYPFFIGT